VIPGYLSYTHENVVRAVPELLRRCAYSPDCLPACLDLLWELDGGDERAEREPYFDGEMSPCRIITDMAGYQPDKPLYFYWAVLEAVRRWLLQPDVWDRRYTPLDALGPLLEKSGVQHEADGFKLSLRPFHLDYESLRELRGEVLNTLDGCLLSQDIRAVLRSVQGLGDGLVEPMPYFSMTFTAEDLRQWEPEQLRILEMLGCLIERNRNPVVTLAVLQQVRYQARYGPLEAVRERATILIQSIDRSFDFRLTRMLLPEMSRWDLFEEEVGADPVAEREGRYQALARSVAVDFWDRFPNPAAAIVEIDRRIREIQAVESTCDATDLAWWLFETRPETVTPFVRELLGLPNSLVARCLGVGLVHLHRTEPAAAVEFARKALDTGAVVFCQAVAQHFGWNLRAETPLHEGEVPLIRRLLADPDAGVRSMAVGALRRVAAFNPREALDLARAVDVGAGPRIVTELCRLGDPDWGGCREAFTDEDVNAFLQRIEGIDDLNHDVARFLKFACERTPHAVVDMLLRRIDRQEREGYLSDFRPVPFQALHDTFAGLAGTNQHRELLCRVRDYSLGKEGLTINLRADLYRDVSQRYGATGIEVLAEWLLNGNQEQLEVATALLEEAPSGFVFDQIDLVSRVLDRAEGFGDGCSRAVAWFFYKIATSGMRTGTPGQPFPKDIALRDRCQEVLAKLPVGCAASRLFRDVLSKADRDIEVAVQAAADED
jgi:hypothetical protein